MAGDLEVDTLCAAAEPEGSCCHAANCGPARGPGTSRNMVDVPVNHY